MSQQAPGFDQVPLLAVGAVADAHHDLRPLHVVDESEAQVVVFDQAAAGQPPLLVAAGVVALVEGDGAVDQVSHRVQAVHALSQLPHVRGRRLGDGQFGVDVLQVPLEGLALQPVPQLQALRDAAKRSEMKTRKGTNATTHSPNGMFLAKGTEA
jgi:hypothetical protein